MRSNGDSLCFWRQKWWENFQRPRPAARYMSRLIEDVDQRLIDQAATIGGDGKTYGKIYGRWDLYRKIYGIWDGIWCGIYISFFFRSHGNVRGTEYYWMNCNDLSIWDWGFHSHGDTPIVSHLWERSYGLTRVFFFQGSEGRAASTPRCAQWIPVCYAFLGAC